MAAQPRERGCKVGWDLVVMGTWLPCREAWRCLALGRWQEAGPAGWLLVAGLCETPGTPRCPTAQQFQPAPAPPPPAQHDKEAGAAAGCNRLFTRLRWGSRAEVLSHNVSPRHRSRKTLPAAEPGLCLPSSSPIPVPAFRTAAAPCARCHVPGTKESVTKAGACARCRRPLPLQGLRLLHRRVPRPKAQHGAPYTTASLLSPCSRTGVLLRCCSGAVSWARAVHWKSYPALPLRGNRGL